MSKPTSMILGAALLAAISLAPRRGAAEGACIPATVTAALADCAAAPASPATPAADVLAAAAQLQSRAGKGNLPTAKTRSKGPVVKLAARDLDDAEKKQESLFRGFLCADKPAPGDAKASAQHAEIEYALARLYFSANRFAEAAVTFGDIALHRSDTRLASTRLSSTSSRSTSSAAKIRRAATTTWPATSRSFWASIARTARRPPTPSSAT